MNENPTVLVVDDDMETAKIFDYFLRKEGYNALLASNVNQAMEHLEHMRPDVILLDLMLPGANGIELLKHLRMTPETANVYVIIISAHAIENQHLPTGVLPDDVLCKPIRIPTLREAISKGLA